MIRSATLTGLLAHELRLWARGWIRAKPKRWRLAIQGVFILLAFSCVAGFAGVPLGLWLARTEIGMTPMLGMIGAGAVSILFTLMLSQTLLGAVATLYERGDLDLLLSSPVQPSHVLTAKAAGMTVKAGTIFAILLSPLLIPVAILAHPEWLAAYGVLAALALASTAAGLWLSMLLFRTIGPRRTKTVAQLLAAIIGAAFFIVSQLQHLFGEDRAGSFWTRVVTDAQSGAMTVPAWVYWPTRAAFGEPGPLAAVLAAGAALFALAVATVGRSFAQDAAAASGAGASGRKTARGRGGEFSATPFQAVFRKEVRLLVRDPMLLSQVLLRVLYLIPLAFLLIRNASEDGSPALAGAAAGLVFMAGQVAASLSWITLSAEDAPALVTLSPTGSSLVWRAKLAAGLAPLILLVGTPVAALAYFSPVAAVWTAFGASASALGAGLINIWTQKPGKRSEFRRRRSSSIVASIMEVAVGALFAAATGLAVYGFAWWASVIPAVLGLALLAAMRRSEGAVLNRLAEEAA